MRTLQEYINLTSVLLMILAVTMQVLSGNQTGRQTYVVRYKHGENLIPVTVVLDYKRQTEYVINMNSRTPAQSVTLYDFKERVIAYKDLKNGECFIGRLTHETIHEEDAVLKRLKSPVESQPLILTLDPGRPSLTPTEVRNTAGHKTAVFCRRMNTWTLRPVKENRREKRDTLNHLDIPTVRHDENRKTKRVSLRNSEIFKAEKDSANRNQTHQDFSGFQRNLSFPVTHRRREYHEPGSSTHTTLLDPFNQQQRLNNVYPFVLPRQQNVLAKNDEIRGLRQNFNIYNASRNDYDDSIHRFALAQEESSAQTLPEFSQLRPSGFSNGTSVSSSGEHSFIPLKTNRPILIPSINFPNKFPENKFSGDHDVSHINTPGSFSGSYPQNSNNGYTLHKRGETSGNYPPPFHQLPPEAFVLPLTRSSTATTSPSFVFNNRLGYEIVPPDSPPASNNTDLLNALDGSVNKTADDFERFLTARSDESSHEAHSPSSTRIFGNREASGSIPAPPLLVHSITPNIWSNEIEKNYNEPNASSNNRLLNNSDSSLIDHRDTPIQVPRWYPEIRKEISIPLEIEVIDHQEEYGRDISNSTRQVYPAGGLEVEDHLSHPNANTIIPIPIEAYSNGLRFDKELKLLPQVGGIPGDDDDSSKRTLSQAVGRRDEKVERRFEQTKFKENIYPIDKEVSNNVLHEVIPHIKPTTDVFPANGTEVKDSIQRSNTDSVTVTGVRKNFVNEFPHQKPSHEGTIEENRFTGKGQQHIDEGPFPINDFKIDEGLPSYRKRFPAVSQLFTPDETVAGVESLPGRNFHLRQQNTNTRKRPSSVRNRTRGTQQLGHQSPSTWRKHELGSSRNFINRQETRFSGEGITFHHRGYGKPGAQGAPYDHHRKRLGLLPPGVSVHPRHPQAPYADLAMDNADKAIPVNPLLHSQPRRVHLRHHRRHQRKRNRILPQPDTGLSTANCCGGDGPNCCSNRRRGRYSPKAGCCSQPRESRRPNLVPVPPPSKKDENEVSRKKVEDVAEDRCMKEKMCRTVYQSTKKVLVCRNIKVDGC